MIEWDVGELQKMECDRGFEWIGDQAEDGLMPVLAGAPSGAWIFDHVPKTGGSEFSLMCDQSLPPLDHLRVPWPGSWNGVILGRLQRASIIHGHGSRYAKVLAPHRDWKTAITWRDPMTTCVSQYQQVRRFEGAAKLGGRDFELWLEHEVEERGEVRALNTQAHWMAVDREPSLRPPFFEERGVPTSSAELLQKAQAYLSRCTLVAKTADVAALFGAVVAAAGLSEPIPAQEAAPDRVPANTSALDSDGLLASISPSWARQLRAWTAVDAALERDVRDHPGLLKATDA
jgi:hypothetical protein